MTRMEKKKRTGRAQSIDTSITIYLIKKSVRLISPFFMGIHTGPAIRGSVQVVALFTEMTEGIHRQGKYRINFLQ